MAKIDAQNIEFCAFALAALTHIDYGDYFIAVQQIKIVESDALDAVNFDARIRRKPAVDPVAVFAIDSDVSVIIIYYEFAGASEGKSFLRSKRIYRKERYCQDCRYEYSLSHYSPPEI